MMGKAQEIVAPNGKGVGIRARIFRHPLLSDPAFTYPLFSHPLLS